MPACIVRRGGKVIDACIAPTPDAALIRALRGFAHGGVPPDAWPGAFFTTLVRLAIRREGIQRCALLEVAPPADVQPIGIIWRGRGAALCIRYRLD